MLTHAGLISICEHAQVSSPEGLEAARQAQAEALALGLQAAQLRTKADHGQPLTA